MRYPLVASLIAALTQASAIRAADAGIEFFEKKIRPVLVEYCYECHAAAAKRIRGGLLLDSRAGVRKGGETGPALEPGAPEKSLLIKAVRYTDDELKMPPKGKLPAAAIADLEAWVKMGAPDPRDKTVVAKPAREWDEIVRERRQWWSLQPVRNPAVPQPKNASWSNHPIDRFILEQLEAKELAPAALADPHTLARRLSLVLTGLPPAPEQVDEFARACKSDPAASITRLVDSLLASPHFGEHWARHWMDVVRFTETHGNEWNYEVHHAWRYRDYLIRAFNDDVPYDQLVREHIAGDLLSQPRWHATEQFNESLIGTAFFRFGEVNHDDCISLRQIGYDLADNQIDTLTKAFQATTVACARCHDHKLDAVSMRDYYSLLGVLRSSRQVSHTIDSPQVNADIHTKMRKTKESLRSELAAIWLQQVPEVVGQIANLPRQTGSPLENPLTPWRMLLTELQDKSFAEAWKKVADRVLDEHRSRSEFNKSFTILADFRKGVWPDWQVGGQGLRGRPSGNGEFVPAAEGERVVSAILPAGAYTHVLSDKFNGTLRSPVLTTDKKWISFRVSGQRSSAVRLVSNNCQLNYKNYKALISTEPQWITFPVPEDCQSLRVYAELMTMFDNPKFPDQLGQLGGDKMDYRIPWEKAAANPRSYFGVTQVVLHDDPSSTLR